jgi:hypothetical protein
MSHRLVALVAAVAVAGLVSAAEPIKLELKDFKWKCRFDTGTELGGYDENDNKLFYYTFGTMTKDIDLPADGVYTITIDASCTAAEKELAKFKLSVGDEVIAKEHALTQEEQKEYTFTAKLKKGKAPLVVEFLNDKHKDGEYDLNLFIHGVKVEAKAPAKAEPKPDVKPAVKPDVKPEAKPALNPVIKPEVKPEAKPAVKPDVKPEVKPEESKGGVAGPIADSANASPVLMTHSSACCNPPVACPCEVPCRKVRKLFRR